MVIIYLLVWIFCTKKSLTFFVSLISKFVAIKIAKLEQISNAIESSRYVFQDLHLDFKKKQEYSPLLQNKIDGNDIAVDYDEDCIRNSILNLFNTRPGQRFLFPRYGLSLHQYLFDAITAENAELIGEAIVRAVTQFESRAVVRQCRVVPKYDDNEYLITLILHIPLFNTTTSINSTLDIKSQSFAFVEKSTRTF
jgi:phage baseplate assembly protein W